MRFAEISRCAGPVGRISTVPPSPPTSRHGYRRFTAIATLPSSLIALIIAHLPTGAQSITNDDAKYAISASHAPAVTELVTADDSSAAICWQYRRRRRDAISSTTPPRAIICPAPMAMLRYISLRARASRFGETRGRGDTDSYRYLKGKRQIREIESWRLRLASSYIHFIERQHISASPAKIPDKMPLARLNTGWRTIFRFGLRPPLFYDVARRQQRCGNEEIKQARRGFSGD